MNKREPIAGILNAVAALRKQLALPEEVGDAQAYLRDLHKAWKIGGGISGGKPRHSDRFLAEQLKAQGKIVRSLTPKLVGNTRIKPQDAEILTQYFLANWPKEGKTDADEITYSRLLPEDAVEELAEFIADELESAATQAPARAQTTTVLPGEEVAALLTTFYAESDALFTVGTERALIPLTPQTALRPGQIPLRGFRDLMNDFWEIEQNDGKPRPLIWVLDFGRQMFDDAESGQRYLSVQDLVARIKALHLFDDRKRDARLRWLESRALFVLLDTRFEQQIDMKGFRRPALISHHVSFSAIPAEWAKSSNFRALYGSELERLDQRTFSVFLNGRGSWLSGGDDDTDDVRFWRYFGHASFISNDRPNPEQVGRSLELPSPGASYEEAYKTMYAAATSILGLDSQIQEPDPVDGEQAIAQLKYLGFRLLRMHEFVSI